MPADVAVHGAHTNRAAMCRACALPSRSRALAAGNATCDVMTAMNEFDLQAWERELGAWQRRLERHPPGELRSLLHALGRQVGLLRALYNEGEALDGDRTQDRLRRGFAELRAIYDREAGGDSATTPA